MSVIVAFSSHLCISDIPPVTALLPFAIQILVIIFRNIYYLNQCTSQYLTRPSRRTIIRINCQPYRFQTMVKSHRPDETAGFRSISVSPIWFFNPVPDMPGIHEYVFGAGNTKVYPPDDNVCSSRSDTKPVHRNLAVFVIGRNCFLHKYLYFSIGKRTLIMKNNVLHVTTT